MPARDILKVYIFGWNIYPKCIQKNIISITNKLKIFCCQC